MTQKTWSEVDSYFEDHVAPRDTVLEQVLGAAEDAGLPAIAVTPHQGKFLYLLARIQGARNVLELGTLAAYSTIWLARALPAQGRVVTIEANEKHAAVARANLERAGVAALVDLRVDDALAALAKIERERLGPFDLTFIDADKKNIPEYFDRALTLSRPGSVIVVDNVVRDGAILDKKTTNADILGVQRFMKKLASDKRVSATTLQTVGTKGYDGFTIAVVNG
jgi:predicted O-methyltransferase YrrM